MANKPVSDEQKFMDVARPGKGKVIGTSRPVAGPIVSDSKASNIEVTDTSEEAEVKIGAPSETRKVIKPLTNVSPEEESEEVSSDNDSPVIESTDVPAKDSPVISEETKPSEDEPTSEKPDDKPEKAADDASTDDSSDAAGVNALAEKAESKKQAAKQAEEAAKQDEALQKLTDSKEYFVPIGHGPSGSRKKPILIALILLLVVAGAGAYYMVTAKSDTDTVSTSSQPDTDTVPKNDTTTDEKTPASTDPAPSEADPSATVATRDTERKNELKSIQQKLEMYFNDNNAYPAALSELALSADESTGPRQDAYVYTPTAVDSSDNQSYTLTAQLENVNDKDAEVSGMYVLQSVNN